MKKKTPFLIIAMLAATLTISSTCSRTEHENINNDKLKTENMTSDDNDSLEEEDTDQDSSSEDISSDENESSNEVFTENGESE